MSLPSASTTRPAISVGGTCSNTNIMLSSHSPALQTPPASASFCFNVVPSVLRSSHLQLEIFEVPGKARRVEQVLSAFTLWSWRAVCVGAEEVHADDV